MINKIINLLKKCKHRLGRVKRAIFKKHKLPYLVVITGTACSLKCRDCGNFVPYAPPNTKRYPLKDIKTGIAKILKAVDELTLLQIQGGEPFLYSELDALLAYVVAQKKIRRIEVATNGVTTPNDNTLPYLQHPKVTVRVSDYRTVTKGKTDTLVQHLIKHNIKHWVYEFAYNTTKWFDMNGITTIEGEGGGISLHRENDTVITEKRFATCPFRDCLTLEHNLVGRCSRCIIAMSVQHFDGVPGDYVDTRIRHFKKAFLSYITTPRYMEACRYCLGGEGGQVEPAIQLP